MTRLSANQAFYLLVSLSGVAFLLLTILLTKIAPLTINHTIYFCQQTMGGFNFSLPHSFPSLLIILLTVILSIGLSLFIFQLIKTEVFIRNVLRHRMITSKRVNTIAKQLGIMGKVDVVKTNINPSFCYGFLQPRICVSSKMIKSLSNGELKAVLLHERYHLKSKDPLKILLSQAIISIFFFVPSLHDIHRLYTISKEVNADQLVVRNDGVQNLRSALTKALENFPLTYKAIASFATVDDIEQRFLILVNPDTKIKRLFSPSKFLLSMTFFVFVLVFVNLPVHAMENSDGTHSYVFMSAQDPQMVSCFTEKSSKEPLFSSQTSTSQLNYSPMH